MCARARASGHPSRLNRGLTNRFGTGGYAQEMLCAELMAAFACAAFGIKPTVHHSDYIGGRMEIIRDYNRAIFRAASQARKAADYLLAFVRCPGVGVFSGAPLIA